MSLSRVPASYSARARARREVRRSIARSSGAFLGVLRPLRIGTRGSPLALAQAAELRARLAAAHGIRPSGSSSQIIRTTGDMIRDRPLAEAGGKGLFTKEIEEALLAGSIDLAVHSAKDMPTVLPAGLPSPQCCRARMPRDVFISRRRRRCASCRRAPLGTASLRRQALVKRPRRDLAVVPFRGNVETRLRKLDAGEVDAMLLALAGLKRLGLADAPPRCSGRGIPAGGRAGRHRDRGARR